MSEQEELKGLKPKGRFYPQGIPLELYGVDSGDVVYFCLIDQHNTGQSSYSNEEIVERLKSIPTVLEMPQEVGELAISEEEPVRVFASINLAAQLTISYVWRIPYRVKKREVTLPEAQV